MANPVAIGYNEAPGQFKGVYVRHTPLVEETAEFLSRFSTIEDFQAWVHDSAVNGGYYSIEEMRSGLTYGSKRSGLVNNDLDTCLEVNGAWVVNENPSGPDFSMVYFDSRYAFPQNYPA